MRKWDFAKFLPFISACKYADMLTVLLGCVVIFMRADLLRCMHDLLHACMIWYMHAKLQLFHARGHTDRSNSREGGREGIFECLCIFELTLRYDTRSREGLLMKKPELKICTVQTVVCGISEHVCGRALTLR
jgi:hypothetical protein